MDDRQINKWLRRRFAPTGWALVGYFVLMNLLVMMAMACEVMTDYLRNAAAGDFWYVPDESALMGNAWGYILAAAVALTILYAWKGGDFWKDEVFAREKPMGISVFACMLCLCAGSQMVNSLWISLLEGILNLFGLSAMGMLDQVSGMSDIASMFLYSAILAPVTEELIFRGFMLRTLRPYGKRFAIFGSAFLFGLFHGNLLQTPYAFLMGLILGYVAVEYSIGWSIGIHMFNNLVLADLLTRLTANLPEGIVSGINMVLFGGCLVAGLAILISRRKEIQAYRRSEWMDRRCLKCFFGNAGVIVLMVLMLGNMVLALFA